MGASLSPSELSPPERVAVAPLRAEWRTVTFAHWPCSPLLVQSLLPSGLTVDEFDGSAWVSFTPFVMADVRLPGLASLPRLSTFPETNLRTYVRGPDGRPGVWFFTIVVGSAALEVVARALVGAPYRLADASVTGDGVRITYAGVRRGGPASYHVIVRTGERITPTSLDKWLVGRWRAYTRHLGTILETPVAHDPWILSTATLEAFDESLTTSAGLPRPGPDPVVHFCESVGCVRVGISRPRAVSITG